MALDRLDDDEKGFSSIDTLGGRQEVAIINESGLYNLVPDATLDSISPEMRAQIGGIVKAAHWRFCCLAGRVALPRYRSSDTRRRRGLLVQHVVVVREFPHR